MILILILPSSHWVIPLHCDLVKKKQTEKTDLVKQKLLLLAIRWYGKYIIAPNSPLFWKSCGEEVGENQQMQSVLLFKQALLIKQFSVTFTTFTYLETYL